MALLSSRSFRSTLIFVFSLSSSFGSSFCLSSSSRVRPWSCAARTSVLSRTTDEAASTLIGYKRMPKLTSLAKFTARTLFKVLTLWFIFGSWRVLSFSFSFVESFRWTLHRFHLWLWLASLPARCGITPLHVLEFGLQEFVESSYRVKRRRMR